MTETAPALERRPGGANLAVTWLIVLAMLGMVAVELWAILALNRGVLLYATDDSYIHLSLAVRLHGGHYGINAGEASSPSSSVLWPILLAPFGAAAQLEWVPFVLNVLAASGTAIAISHLLARALGPASGRAGTAFQAVLGGLLLLWFNVVGLVFVGMEHSLQVFLTLLTVLGLHDVVRTGRPPAWLWPVLVTAPLFRYENLALTLPALAFLGFAGQRRAALVSLAGVVATLGGFSLFLVAHGLPPLPSSVLVKLGMVAAAGDPLAVQERLAHNLFRTWSGPWLLLLATSLVACLWSGGPRAGRAFAGVILAAILGHCLVGGFGWFHRYELYVVVAAVSAASLAHGERLRRWFRAAPRLAGTIALAGLALASGKSLYMLVVTPLATNEVYRQQYMMGRFAREVLRAPVAVNDLGHVSFRNPNFVVDLWGLGSPAALGARKRDRDMAWADSLCRRHDVVAVMIYARWFPALPAAWRHVGDLRLGRAQDLPASSLFARLVRFAHRERGTVVVAGESVSVYAVRSEDEARVRASLERFRSRLVEGAELRLD